MFSISDVSASTQCELVQYPGEGFMISYTELHILLGYWQRGIAHAQEDISSAQS